jgi:hypothetical protein
MMKRNSSPRWLLLPSCLYRAPSGAHFFGMAAHRMRTCHHRFHRTQANWVRRPISLAGGVVHASFIPAGITTTPLRSDGYASMRHWSHCGFCGVKRTKINVVAAIA